MSRRAIFLGAFDPAVAAAMRGWLSAGNEIAGFWYWAPKHKGSIHRDARLAWLAPRWSVRAVTRRHNIPMRSIPRPASWPERLSAFGAEDCDVLVSVYFPCVIPSDVLEIFGTRAVNLHPAPLPRYRGPTPIHAMALDQSIVTDGAMTLHVMSPQLDQGAIIAREPIPFPGDASFVHYLLNAARAAGRLVQHALPAYLNGQLVTAHQDESNATCPRVTEDDMAISSTLYAGQVQLRCLLFARRRALHVKGCPGARISGFLRELGPPTGTPPRLYRTAVEIDMIDRRVLLRRRMPWSSLRGKCQDWLAYLAVRG